MTIPIDTTTGRQCGPRVFDSVVGECFGVMCPFRARCRLYLRPGLADGEAMDSCQVGKSWPLFCEADDETS